ncbi:MAG: GMC family oxidoreductase N-terminal domain-containing protein [Alphaproteobacteria bacterium]
MTRADFDYIVVGGGSAGCVTAGKLVGEHGARVLLLEAGWPDSHPLLRMPAGFVRFIRGSRYVTEHVSSPQDQLDGRRQIIIQANVLGGGSSVNAMVYMRGRPGDYDGWDAAVGGAGWGYADMLPHFIAQEGNQRLNDAFHGIDGPLKVSDPAHACAMSYIYLRTMQGLGIPFADDFNGRDQAGVGFMQYTIADRRRCSAATAFLGPVRGDPRLTLRTGARVVRLRFSGDRVTGVDFVRRGSGAVESAHAAAEVILTAGALVTPQLLMLSGIGPADHLRSHGIAVRADLPGVGANLHDHHEAPVVALTNGRYGYFGEDRGWRMLRNGLQYLLFRTGPVATNGAETCAFVNPDDPSAPATIKLYCVPSVYLDRDIAGVKPADGVTLTACLLQPRGRGRVTLASADPRDRPAIDPGFLRDPADLALQVAGVRFARQVLAARPMRDAIAREIVPGPGVDGDAALAAHCRRTVKTNWHPCGTCRMGRPDDPGAVVGADLRVRGLEGLRVFDASVMPSVPHANTNAPTMALADRGVAIMTGTVALRAADPVRNN